MSLYLFSIFISHSYQWACFFSPLLHFLAVKPVIFGLYYLFNSDFKCKTEENNEKQHSKLLFIQLSHMYSKPEKEEAQSSTI